MTEQREQHTIDATGKRLGRVASEVAILLLDKHRPDVKRHVVTPKTVRVIHASKLLIEERKKGQKIYERYSGHPGGLKRHTMSQVIEAKGYAELLTHAIYGMLPNNKLRAVRMKQLNISE